MVSRRVWCIKLKPRDLDGKAGGYWSAKPGDDMKAGTYGEGFAGEALVVLLDDDSGDWFAGLAHAAGCEGGAGCRHAAGLAVKALLEKAGVSLEVKTKRTKRVSRAAQWADACSRASDALSTLAELKSEYESWRDNLPENLQTSAVGEKLDAVCDLDLDSCVSTIEEAEGLDLPLGYGKD